MASKKIDINKASVEDFEKLIGIGLRKAKAIVKYRKVYIALGKPKL
jgi:competence ComEA-like helix-hairpin-helix protein